MKPHVMQTQTLINKIFISMCGLTSASPLGFIIPLKSKLYYDEN